jgi:hypothetical protein
MRSPTPGLSDNGRSNRGPGMSLGCRIVMPLGLSTLHAILASKRFAACSPTFLRRVGARRLVQGAGQLVNRLHDIDGDLALDLAEQGEVGATNQVALPYLKFARRYPTIGPNGALRTDINGCACSIEVYLGEAALTGEDGVLMRVQWKGDESKLKRYQGELLDKKSVVFHSLRLASLQSRVGANGSIIHLCRFAC